MLALKIFGGRVGCLRLFLPAWGRRRYWYRGLACHLFFHHLLDQKKSTEIKQKILEVAVQKRCFVWVAAFSNF